MNINLDANTILQGISLFLLVAGIKGIFSMNEKLNKMNGSIGKLWLWREEHEKLSGAKHETMEKNITALWDQYNESKK